MKILSKSSGSALQRYCLNCLKGNDGFSSTAKVTRTTPAPSALAWNGSGARLLLGLESGEAGLLNLPG
jgi:hypothetical protein